MTRFPGARLPAEAAQLAACGHAFARAGQYAAAESCYRQALAIAGTDAALTHNLAMMRIARGDLAEARAWLQRCVALMSAAAERGADDADARIALGVALEAAGDVECAEQQLRRALAIEPSSVMAQSHLCDLLGRDGRAAQAARELEAMLGERPDDPAVLFKLGYVKAFLGDICAGEALMRRVIGQLPDFAGAWLNLGTFAQWRGEAGRAIDCFRRAQALAPGDPVVLGNLAHALLYAGRHAEGWEAYETRPMGVLHPSAARAHPHWGPRWNGDDLGDGTLLVHGEGGLGDVIQFSRYIAAARACAAKVVLRLESKYAALASLLATVPGISAVVGEEEPATATAYCSLSSLPYLLWHAGVPCATPMPYLSSKSALVSMWRARRTAGARRVGIAWGGGAGTDRFYGGLVDRRRSIPFPLLEPLFALPGIEWHSLQKGFHADEWRAFAFAGGLVDETHAFADFADTAAYAASLDLVVTVDTSVAHLAGALGLDTWMLNRFDSCWRWGVAGTTTHWYPSMRIFRQPHFGDWPTVIAEVRDRLARLA